ncbi:glutamate-rich protein 2 isoform X2 [Planococcus citri]
MEMNGNTLKSGSNSSNEDLSQYTDADESMSAPTEILAEFLSALMLKDYPSALKFCKIILQYEPNHETAKQFYPLIQEKLSIQQANQKHQLDNQIEECSSEDDETSANSDENGNILELDDASDISSTGSGDQRDSEETTASYSSLEDEVVDSNTLTETHKLDQVSDSQTNSDFTDDNGNIPSMSTTTSDSDSFPECKKVSAKLKSLLPYRKSNRYSKHVPI